MSFSAESLEHAASEASNRLFVVCTCHAIGFLTGTICCGSLLAVSFNGPVERTELFLPGGPSCSSYCSTLSEDVGNGAILQVAIVYPPFAFVFKLNRGKVILRCTHVDKWYACTRLAGGRVTCMVYIHESPKSVTIPVEASAHPCQPRLT